MTENFPRALLWSLLLRDGVLRVMDTPPCALERAAFLSWTQEDSCLYFQNYSKLQKALRAGSDHQSPSSEEAWGQFPEVRCSAQSCHFLKKKKKKWDLGPKFLILETGLFIFAVTDGSLC